MRASRITYRFAGSQPQYYYNIVFIVKRNAYSVEIWWGSIRYDADDKPNIVLAPSENLALYFLKQSSIYQTHK